MWFSVTLPSDLAEGEATVRVLRSTRGGKAHSAGNSLMLPVSKSTVPLSIDIDFIKPVAAGQWLTLPVENVERLGGEDCEAEAGFSQGRQYVAVPVVGVAVRRLLVPNTFAPGEISVTFRNWCHGAASAWSRPVTLKLPATRVEPKLFSLAGGDINGSLWIGNSIPEPVRASPGGRMILTGEFSVESPARLEIVFDRAGGSTPARVTPTGDFKVSIDLTFQIPDTLEPGDWRLSVRNLDSGESVRVPLVLKIEKAASDTHDPR